MDLGRLAAGLAVCATALSSSSTASAITYETHRFNNVAPPSAVQVQRAVYYDGGNLWFSSNGIVFHPHYWILDIYGHMYYWNQVLHKWISVPGTYLDFDVEQPYTTGQQYAGIPWGLGTDNSVWWVNTGGSGINNGNTSNWTLNRLSTGCGLTIAVGFPGTVFVTGCSNPPTSLWTWNGSSWASLGGTNFAHGYAGNSGWYFALDTNKKPWYRWSDGNWYRIWFDSYGNDGLSSCTKSMNVSHAPGGIGGNGTTAILTCGGGGDGNTSYYDNFIGNNWANHEGVIYSGNWLDVPGSSVPAKLFDNMVLDQVGNIWVSNSFDENTL